MDVSQYLDIFIDETSEHIQNLNDCIMVLEKEPDNKDTINEIFRAAHSLKGMAGTMGFKRMQRLTHDMENVFQEVRSDKIKVNGVMIDILFQCLDAIEGYLETIKSTSDEGTEDNEAIIQSLNATLEGRDNEAGEGKAEEKPAEKKQAKEEKPAEASKKEVPLQKKFMDIPLDDKDIAQLKDCENKGQHIVGVTVYIDNECLLKSARAFLVFKALEELGEIVIYSPSSQDIEDEKFEFDFSVMVATGESVEKVKEAAMSVSEIENAVVEQITCAMLEQNQTQDTDKQEQEESSQKEEAETKPAVRPATKAAPSAPANKNTVSKPVTNRTVRVDIEKLDALMNQVSELIIAKNSLVSISSQETGAEASQTQSFHEQIEYLERITTGLHESVMKVRMVPIENVVNKFPRMIRDLAKKLDKKMELYMSGEDTELDRTVVDQIGDPLQHLLRNSADHGLEDAAVRAERGKPEVGSITLNAYQEGNNVIIEVSDDGNGIDTERVKTKAIERGLVTPEVAETMSQKEIIDFLFMPSFSMAKQISDISGRGVGLDVVKSNIEALGGDVEVRTKLGEGSKFIVRLPLTLAIIQALMVEIQNEKYAIALASIQNIEDIPVNEIKYVQAKEVITIRGMVIPLVRLEKVLDIKREEEDTRESLTVVIVRKGENYAGLVVDNLMGQQEIVIKSLGGYINNNKIISGATILGDGEVALILDANALI